MKDTYQLVHTVVGKYGIVGVITTLMLLVGLLCNMASDKNPLLVPHPDWCHHSSLYTTHQETLANMTSSTTVAPLTSLNQSLLQEHQPSMYIPNMPRGLAETTAVFCFVWPLLPMLLNSRKTFNGAKMESILSHVLGQTSNFGIAEVFRTQIAYPEDLFLDKCNLSPLECLRLSQEKILLPLYLPRPPPPDALLTDGLPRNPAAMCKGQFYNMANNNTKKKDLFKDEAIIYNSLHHYPDSVCMLFGSALVSFVATILHWRKLNPAQKRMKEASTTVRSILTVSDIAMMTCFLFYLYNLYVAYDMLQIVGVFIGILLQVMINRTVAYKHQEKKKKTDTPTTGDGVDSQEPKEYEFQPVVISS